LAAVPSPNGRPSFAGGPARAPQAAATEGLYERHSAKILSYCLHQLGSREEAEDAVQTTFMNAFRALGRGVVPEAESAWLFKIAENVCLSRRRSSWRRGRIESPSDFEVIEEIVPGPSRQRDELIGIEDALASMPEQQRRAILLREWQGLSYREISEELELSQSAVETLIFRARRSLAQGLEQPDLVKKPKRKGLRRALHAIDLGTLAAAAKTLIAGGVAAKATVAAVAVTTAAATAAGVTPKLEGHSPQPAASAPAAVVPATDDAPGAVRAPMWAVPSVVASGFVPDAFVVRAEPIARRGAELNRPVAASRPSLPGGSVPAVATPVAAVPVAPVSAPGADAPVETAAAAASAAIEPSSAPDQPLLVPAPVEQPKSVLTPAEPARPFVGSDQTKTKTKQRGAGKSRGTDPGPVLGSSPSPVAAPAPVVPSDDVSAPAPVAEPVAPVVTTTPIAPAAPTVSPAPPTTTVEPAPTADLLTGFMK
jgi:RNA polymerase sigma factor (sigma-70 family)